MLEYVHLTFAREKETLEYFVHEKKRKKNDTYKTKTKNKEKSRRIVQLTFTRIINFIARV